MKVWIEGDEMYPVFEPTMREDTAWGQLDVPLSTLHRWEKTLAAFHALQSEINDLLDERDKAAGKGTPR